MRLQSVLCAMFACTCFIVAPASAGLFSPADSKTISTATKQALNDPIDELTTEVEHLHPVAMFFLAKRLSDSNRMAEATFWFYEGQLRWRAHLKTNHDVMEQSMFDRQLDDIGPDINTYAFSDVSAMLNMIDAVLDWDAKHPDDFTPAGTEKDAVRDGLVNFKTYIVEHQDEINKKNEERKHEATATSNDPYAGNGGALFGTPSEMVKPYDAKQFDRFKVGVTKKAEVVRALGKPEWWSTDKDGVCTLGYPYYLTGPGMQLLGMAQSVSVTFTFDKNKVLTKIGLPKQSPP